MAPTVKRTLRHQVVRAHQKRGTLPADPDPEALARLLLMVVPGFILQLALAGEQAVDGIPEAARALWVVRLVRP